MKRVYCMIAFLLIGICLSAQSVPRQLSYQGKLMEDGLPVTGTKTIIFNISSLWEEQQTIQVEDGLYSAILGIYTPIPEDIFNNTDLELTITVNGQELSPPVKLLSVPYAFKAVTAMPEGNASGDLSGNYPNPTVDKIQNNPVSSNSPTDGQVLKWDGTQLTFQADDGLTLPYSGTNSSVTGNPVFEVIATGDHAIAGNFVVNNTLTNNSALMASSNGQSYALYIQSNGSGGAAEFYANNSGDVISAIQDGSGRAGCFEGDVDIYGTLSKGGGSFKIDHPLDPENKYLFHSFVESPDMMNVYNGNIALDINGEAIVYLPEWFYVLNKDYRYQLTCIGGFAPVYISEKISGNSFKIAGGTSGMEISWQITGIRQDPYANQHRIQVEVEKPENEKGHYLHYKEYNQPFEKSIRIAKHPELLEDLNK